MELVWYYSGLHASPGLLYLMWVTYINGRCLAQSAPTAEILAERPIATAVDREAEKLCVNPLQLTFPKVNASSHARLPIHLTQRVGISRLDDLCNVIISANSASIQINTACHDHSKITKGHWGWRFSSKTEYKYYNGHARAGVIGNCLG